MTSFFLQLRPTASDLTNLFVVALGLHLASLASAQTTGPLKAYTVLEIPAAADGGQIGLNNLGNVAGRADDSLSAESMATVWNYATRRPQKLASLFRDEFSSASGINDLGEVVGASNTDTSLVPFVSRPNRGMERVPILSGDNGGRAAAINKHGDVVGYSSGSRGVRAFIWRRRAGEVRDLGVLSGGSYSSASDVNDSGEIVGTSASATGDRAVLWTVNGSACDLGTLPGDTSSEAAAINNSGEVVGYSDGPQGRRAFLWTKVAGIQELDVLPGCTSSRAFDISDSGQVVGTYSDSSGKHRAFMWSRQMSIIDLNDALSPDIGIILLEAHALNNKGQIIATGMARDRFMANSGTASGDHRCAPAPGSTFLLTPIPAN